MLNMGKMMKQVSEMQNKMKTMQAELENLVMTGQAGNDMVVATMSGKGDLKSIKIDPKAVDADDLEMLEDLVVAAVRDAKAKIDAHVAGETEKAMGGLKLPPGMNLPF